MLCTADSTLRTWQAFQDVSSPRASCTLSAASQAACTLLPNPGNTNPLTVLLCDIWAVHLCLSCLKCHTLATLCCSRSCLSDVNIVAKVAGASTVFANSLSCPAAQAGLPACARSPHAERGITTTAVCCTCSTSAFQHCALQRRLAGLSPRDTVQGHQHFTQAVRTLKLLTPLPCSDAWLAFLRLPLPAATFKRVLLRLHTTVLPALPNPLLVADFLTRSLQRGGMAGMLALNGIFVLVTQHGLEYPEFYTCLYNLLEVRLAA